MLGCSREQRWRIPGNSSIARPESISYWLDLKTLNPKNASAVAERLAELSRQFGIEREQFFVESHNTRPLGTLHRAGLRTSYYLPSLNAKKASPQQLEKFASTVLAGVEESGVDYISFPGEMLTVINERVAPHLPETRLLTWFPNEFISKRESMTRLEEITQQATLDVVLVGYPTHFDR